MIIYKKILGTMFCISLAIPAFAKTPHVTIPALTLHPVKVVKHKKKWPSTFQFKQDDRFYENAIKRNQTIKTLAYKISVIKMQTILLRLSVAQSAANKALSELQGHDQPRHIMPIAASPTRQSAPVADTLQLSAVLMQHGHKTAALMDNGEVHVVHEGDHIAKYIVQSIHASSVDLKNHKKTKHLILDGSN